MTEPRNSRLPGFSKLSAEGRLEAIAHFAGLDLEALAPLASPDNGLPQSIAEHMSETTSAASRCRWASRRTSA